MQWVNDQSNSSEKGVAMLALVLGGGGAKGAYEIGVWRALIELDIDSKIDIAVGTSIGSLNAAFVAQRDYDKAIEMWKKFDAGKLLHVDNYKALDEKQKTISSMQNVTKDILYEGGVELTEYLETVKKYIDENLVRKSKIRYAAVTVDITNQKPVEKLLKDMKKGQLAEYITASSSLAPALKPHEIEGVKHIDGGFFDVLPINLAVKMGADEVIAVDLNATGRIRKIEQPDKIKDIKYIRSYWNLGNVLVFDEQRVHRNMMLGYLDTMKLYGAFDGNAYTFIKSSNNKGLNASAKAKYDALQLEKSSGRKLFALADKIIERHWSILVNERNKHGVQKTNDILACAEMAAEVLEIDPTKIYTIDGLNQRIKEELAKLEEASFPTIKNELIQQLSKDIATITDEKQRIKYFATEIANDIKENRELWVQKLAPLFVKEFYVGLYIAVNDLV